ncbi:hypothetical protein V865_004494 [Kwoniella europaea PYCC6329]|uniref:Uncharacterized protein n=1 Tax=Kwoniella europaea PYCC6329 TaxID=1423913 RepID=A0AAX4KK91_9TREE
MTFIISLWLFFSILITVSARPLGSGNTKQKPLSYPSPINILLPSNRADIWDFGSEFSNLCSHLYLDIDNPLEPRFVDAKVERTLLNDDYHPDEALASCIYQYPSGEMVQLAPFVAEELHCFTLSPTNVNKMREEVISKDKNRGSKMKFSKDLY